MHFRDISNIAESTEIDLDDECGGLPDFGAIADEVKEMDFFIL